MEIKKVRPINSILSTYVEKYGKFNLTKKERQDDEK